MSAFHSPSFSPCHLGRKSAKLVFRLPQYAYPTLPPLPNSYKTKKHGLWGGQAPWKGL